MSRSFRKTPVFGYTKAESEKFDKQKANRRFRRKTKMEVQQNKELFTLHRRQTTAWDMRKDGKRYYKNYKMEWMRK